MVFKSKEDLPSSPPEMFHESPGDRDVDPNTSSQGNQHHMGASPQQTKDEEHKRFRGCNMWQWKRGMDNREMSPEEYREMVLKMQKAREEFFKGHHRRGCWSRFSATKFNEDKQNPTSEYFFLKQTLHSNLYC